jgi:hypothetical protein
VVDDIIANKLMKARGRGYYLERLFIQDNIFIIAYLLI